MRSFAANDIEMGPMKQANYKSRKRTFGIGNVRMQEKDT